MMGIVRFTPEFLYEISSMLLAYNQFCDKLGMSEEQRRDPSAGIWMGEVWDNLVASAHVYHTKALLQKRDKKEVKTNPLIGRYPSIEPSSEQSETSSKTNGLTAPESETTSE